jgi:hypothetical protein
LRESLTLTLTLTPIAGYGGSRASAS